MEKIMINAVNNVNINYNGRVKQTPKFRNYRYLEFQPELQDKSILTYIKNLYNKIEKSCGNRVNNLFAELSERCSNIWWG